MKRIPTDTVWKWIVSNGKRYLVPDFGTMRNRIRNKNR